MFPQKETKVVGGLKCKAKSFKRNLAFYKDIGARLKIKGRRKTIREKGTRVFLSNFYFLKDDLAPSASAQLIEWVFNPGTDETVDKKVTRHKHFVVGANVKLNGESASVGPLTPQGALPFAGVVSEARVIIGNDESIIVTQVGSVPPGFVPPLLKFRQAGIVSVRATLKRVKGINPPISLLRDVFELNPSQQTFEGSLKRQIRRLEPKQPEGQFNYRYAYFFMGLNDLAHRTNQNDTNTFNNIGVRGSFRTTPPDSESDAFRLTEVRQVNEPELGLLLSNAQFFIVQNGHGDIVVLFRGATLTQHDSFGKDQLLKELGVTSTEYEHVPSSSGHPNLVHEKIYRAYQAFETALETALRRILKKMQPSLPHIYFTGYGVGGALATLAALDFVVKRDDLRQIDFMNIPASLYSFGSPRVLSSKTHQNLYRSRLVSSFAVVHRDDPFPALPPILTDSPDQLSQVDHVILIDDNLVNMKSVLFDPNESGDADVRPIAGVAFDTKFSMKIIPHEFVLAQVRKRYQRQLLQLHNILEFDDELDDFEEEDDDADLNLPI